MRWIVLAMLVACDCEGSATNGGRDGSVASYDAEGRDVARPAFDSSMPMNCGSLVATVRDFHGTHPDFETYSGSDAYTGLVEDMLGADGNPVYAHPGATPQTTGPAEFAQWYSDALGIAPMGTYAMDIFHAERHTNESNFRIETTIDCFLLI